MNIKKILEGLNIDNQLIDIINQIIFLDSFINITSFNYNNKKLNICFKLSKETLEDESHINIDFPSKKSNRLLVNIDVNEYLSNYGRVNIEDVRRFKTNNKYTFEYEPSLGICGYSCQHSLVELLDERANEEITGINQNDYNIFVFDNMNVKSYGKDKFLSLLGITNKEVSNLDMILLGKNYFINNVSSKNLLIQEKSLSLKMK